MMRIEELLARLEKPKTAGKGKWVACCPAHLDASPSLSIKQADDGKILVHCFAGCTTDDVLGAIGVQFTDLFPEGARPAMTEDRPIKFSGSEFTALDALRCLVNEAAVVGLAAAEAAEGHVMRPQEQHRLDMAVSRLAIALAFVEDSCSL